MVRCVAGQYDVAVIEQFVATVVKANVWFRQEGNKTLCDFKRCRHVACMVKSTARPAVKRVASRMHSAHVVSTGGHGNLGFANRADQRVIDVNVDNELAIQRSPRSHNGRFLRHRPERSERCLNYEILYHCQPASPNMEGVPKARA